MADTTAQGASADTPTFNLASVMHLLHGVAYQRQNTIHLTQEQYSTYCRAREAVEDAAVCLQRTHAGLELLLDMLSSSAVDRYVSEAMRGLLNPIALHLEHHAKTLAATIAE